MVYILVEITGFRALKKIDPAFTNRITADLDKILESSTNMAKKQYGSIIFFSYTPDLEDIKRLFAQAKETYEYLLSLGEKLRGFTVFIDQSKGILSKLQRKAVIRKLYRIWERESFCISNEAFDLFGRMAECVQHDGYYTVAPPDKITGGGEEEVIDFLTGTPEIAELMDAFEPLLNNEKKGLFFYHGPKVPGVSYLAYGMAAMLGGNTAYPRVIVYPEKNDYSLVHPFMRCLQKDMLEMVPSLLEAAEREVWKDFEFPIRNAGGSLCEEDVVIIFRLYLTAYGRFAENQNLPFTVYFMDVDRFDERTLEIAAGILEEFSRTTDIIPVLFSLEPDIPACFHNFSIVRCPPSGEVSTMVSPVSLFHRNLLQERGQVTLSGLRATRGVFDDFDSFTRRTLYLATVLDGLLGQREIIDLLTDENLDRIKYSRAFTDLTACGFLYPDHILPVFPDLLPELQKGHGEAEKGFFDRLTVSFEGKTESTPQEFISLADIFTKIGEPVTGLKFTFHGVKALVKKGRTEQAVTLLKDASYRMKHLPGIEKEYFLLHDQLFLYAALFDGRDQLAHDFYQKILSPGEGRYENFTTDRYSILSEYFYARYDHNHALEMAKKALLRIQHNGDRPGESSINILLGKIMLGMQRIDEARDYFRISRELLSGYPDHPLMVSIYYLESISHYMGGTISESLRLLAKGIASADRQGQRKWQLLFLFAAGRISFDLGRYKESSGLFAQCLTLAQLYGFDESVSTIYSWLGRGFVYSGSRGKGREILEHVDTSAERLFFTAEYFYFEGRYEEALNTMEASLQLENDSIKIFHPPGFALGESGFEYIEDLVFVMNDGHGVLFHLVQAFKAFLSVLVLKTSQGADELARLTRDEKISDSDPYNGFYYFLHALCYPEKPGTDDLDRLTLLSKALRHVQTIASRIDVPSERIEYLNRNYWNSRLLSAGKKNKLL